MCNSFFSNISLFSILEVSALQIMLSRPSGALSIDIINQKLTRTNICPNWVGIIWGKRKTMGANTSTFVLILRFSPTIILLS